MEFIIAVVARPPHIIFGYTWSELASIIAVISVIAVVISWIVRVVVTKPMEHSNQLLGMTISDLAEKVKGIGDNADRVHENHDRRLDEHDVHLAKHDEELKTLFRERNKRHHEN